MGNEKVLSQAITDAGFPGSDILARANEQKVKDELRARTQAAKDVGINGVPSYRVFTRDVGQAQGGWKQVGDIVWGQDLTADVEDYIAGWDGREVAKIGGERSERHSRL